MWSTRRLATHPMLSRPVLGKENDADLPTDFVNIAFSEFGCLGFFVILAFFFPLFANFWSSVPMDLSSQICRLRL